MQNLLKELTQLLEQDDRLVVEGQLLKNKIVELALAMDADMIRLLLSHEAIRRHFFTDVEGLLVFDKIKFQQFVSNKEFLPDSYTAFKNKIGLTADGQYLTDSKEVVLAWPYKDCVLEGGQTKEDAKRDEIFWNETLAPDQIDRLLSPKALTNFKRYDKDGEHEVSGISQDDNLIIKGNNLLALHTLEEVYAEKVKLIYIDPPYNTDNDSFRYNDSFNHSTWLTFMKNRLDTAKDLLQPRKGVIAISIDHKEAFHLKLLCDEVFGRDNFLSSVTVQNNPKGRVMDKNFSTSNEYLLFYSRGPLDHELAVRKSDAEIKKNYSEKDDNGYYRALELRNTHREYGKHNRKNLFFPLWVCPEDQSVSLEETESHSVQVLPLWDDGYEGCWTWSITKCQVEGDLLLGRFVNEAWKIYRKSYATDHNGTNVSKQLKTIWFSKDFHTEKGQKTIDELLGKGAFKSPKPVGYLKTIIDLVTDSHEEHLVLDFFAGSGTTAQAVLELNKEDGGNRRFILSEQMDYVESVTRTRVHKVIERNGEDSFTYCELAQSNQAFIDRALSASDTKTLQEIWQEMQDKAFLSYRIDPKTIDAESAEFTSLKLDDQKRFLIEILDKNMLYVPFSEIDDETYGISDEDKNLNRSFFSQN